MGDTAEAEEPDGPPGRIRGCAGRGGEAGDTELRATEGERRPGEAWPLAGLHGIHSFFRVPGRHESKKDSNVGDWAIPFRQKQIKAKVKVEASASITRAACMELYVPASVSTSGVYPRRTPRLARAGIVTCS